MTRSLLVVLVLGVVAPTLGACGGGECAGFVAPDADVVDVGDVGVGQTRSASVTVGAPCERAVEVTASVSGAGFAVSPESLEVDGEATFEVSFTAASEDAATGELTLTGEDGSVVTLSLTAQGIPWVDEDGDGFSSVEVGGDDCDDADPDVNPGADEVWYDGVDQDCDGESDFDQDGDGVDTPEDCDDTDPDVRPGIDDPVDEQDSDCDGLIDEGPLGVDDILITEVMHRPAATDDDIGEWIEIRNQGSAPLPLRGLRVTDADGEGGFTIDRVVSVPAEGYAVLAADGRASNNGGAPVDFVYDRRTLPLPDEEGGVQLVGAGDRVISRVAWAPDWIMADGASLQVDPSATEEADLAVRGLWCPSTTPMAGGDAGTPQGDNVACPRFDADEDGFAAQDGDCDDTDPDVNPAATEAWGDGIDNDCDGLKDRGAVAGLRDGRLTGSSSPNDEALGYLDALSVGDVDDDGEDEVLLGARFGDGYGGAVYLLERSELDASGSVAAAAFATFSGGSASNQLGSLAPFAGDVTGDGIADLVIGGTDARDSDDRAAVVIAGGSGLSGSLGIGDAVLEITGAVATTAGDVHGGLDLDGDGVAELVYGDVGPSSFTGEVSVFDGGTTGTVDVADAVAVWTGSSSQDQAGAALGGDDLDGDGYDELLVSSWGSDIGAANGGALYLMAGGARLPADGELADRAATTFVGDVDGRRLGDGAAARVGDFDGDARLDLVVGAPSQGLAFVWFDAADRSGVVDTPDVTLEGPGDPDSFGFGLTVGDLDGDALDEVIVGAPDDQTAVTDLAESPGQVWIFDLDPAGPATLGAAEARAVLRGETVGDAMGQSLLALDVDGDGTDDLLIGAIGDADGAGAVHLVGF